ncbi:MAG: hypothetical protein HZA54_13985 [Planctomycetes bacterium]|nr:hypothetical protein [Planctomycetota bacterium]
MTEDAPTPGTRRAALELTAASCVVLFQELVLIRWLPGQIRVLAYFPNLILLSAFLGLGIGALRAGRRSLLAAWPAALLLLVAATAGMSRVAFTLSSPSEHLWLLYYDLPAGAPVYPGIRLPIVLSFLLCAAAFVPLGQVVAERLRLFAAAGRALRGYIWDLCGSLLGVAAFAALGLTGAFPTVWFALFLLAALIFLAARPRLALVHAAAGVVLVGLVHGTERAQTYSPYYALATDPTREPGRLAVLANGSLHQIGISMRRDAPVLDEAHQLIRDGYHFPYRLLPTRPGRALVLGAGTGNDVAVLLDEGADRIDAVEIDPAILALGRRHPDRPYDSPRVRTHVTDARSFLNESSDTYDVIVFGTLDSMTRVSAFSNVRLDNYVYTRNCMQAARARLAPAGGMLLYFMVGEDYIHQRLFEMLAQVCGEEPLSVSRYFGLFNQVYQAGPAFAAHAPEERRRDATTAAAALAAAPELPTDDWPYLYLRERGVSGFYLSVIAWLAAISVIGLFAASPEFRASLWRDRTIDLPMFLFGLGFLLLETRSVTAMNLLWGATWLTSAVVFGGMLAMIAIATLIAERRWIALPGAFAGLGTALLAQYLVPVEWLLPLHGAARLAASALLVGLPVGFAGVCFGVVYAGRQQVHVAFGWNLLGAVLGGLLEFLSMAVGLRALVLVALVSYGLAYLCLRRAQPPRGPGAPAEPVRPSRADRPDGALPGVQASGAPAPPAPGG